MLSPINQELLAKLDLTKEAAETEKYAKLS